MTEYQRTHNNPEFAQSIKHKEIYTLKLQNWT